MIEQLHALTRGDAIVTTEVGQNQMWAAQFYRFNRPNHFITSGGLGTMGFGLPAAIGAQIACPDKTVVDIAGDGSIQMNIQEMATAVQYELPVKIVILNNGYLGMVRQWQELFYGRRYSATRMDCTPDFVKLAEAYGATGLRAERPLRGGAGPERGPRAARTGDHGLPGGPGGKRLPHGAFGRALDGNAAGLIRLLKSSVSGRDPALRG